MSEYLDEKDAIRALSIYATTLSKAEFEELFKRAKKLRETEKYFILNIQGEKYKVVTEHAYLELERIRKNDLLRDSVNKTVKVTGEVSDVKMYNNSALFCLSPCNINGYDIGHTWVKYTPSFKGIRWHSEVAFYSEIKRYGDMNNKSGVNWQEITWVRMEGGDNEELYDQALQIRDITFRNPEFALSYSDKRNLIDLLSAANFIYTPLGRQSCILRALKFRDIDGMSVVYNTFKRYLVVDGKYVIGVDRASQLSLDKLLMFEWLAKLEDWEFWGWAGHESRSQRER